MGDLGNHDLDLPFEPSAPGTSVDLSDALLAGAVVVMAAKMPVPDVGNFPAIVFRFTTPVGGFHRPILLVLDDDQAAKLPQLVLDAVAAARKAASA